MHDVKRTIDAELSQLHLTPGRRASIAARITRYEEDNMSKKRKLSAALTAALAAIILLGTLAYAAAQSSLLARLFPNATPTPQAEQLLRQVGLSQTQNDCTLIIDEYLLDGTTLFLRWSASSGTSEPVLLLPGTMTAPHYFLSGYSESDTLTRAIGVLLGDAFEGTPLKRSYSATSSINLSSLATLDAPFDVTFTALFMRPVVPIVKLADMTDRNISPTLMIMPNSANHTGLCFLLDRFEWYNDGRNWSISQPDGIGRSGEREAGYSANTDEYERWPESGTNHLTAKDYEIKGYADLVAEIPVTFTVTPDNANIVRAGIEAPLRITFDAFDVELDKVEFTATNVDIHFTVDDKQATDLPVEDLYFEVRPDGQTLSYELAQMKETWAEWPDTHFGMTIKGETPIAAPSFITIVPYLQQQCDYADRTILEDYTMTIQLETAH